MTTTQLIENATKLNATICLDYENQIGVRYPGKFTFHWFDTTYGYPRFSHSYSMNTGSSKKGTMHAIRVKTRLGFYN